MSTKTKLLKESNYNYTVISAIKIL